VTLLLQKPLALLVLHEQAACTKPLHLPLLERSAAELVGLGGVREQEAILPDALLEPLFLPQIQFVLQSINLATGTSS
jgi:hypothetical protein